MTSRCAIGVNWGSPGCGPAHAAEWTKLAPRAADGSGSHTATPSRCRRSQRPARRGARSGARAHHSLGQSERGAGPDRHLPRPCGALRPIAAPRSHRGRHGLQGHRGVHCRHGGAAAGGIGAPSACPDTRSRGDALRESHRGAGGSCRPWGCARSRRWSWRVRVRPYTAATSRSLRTHPVRTSACAWPTVSAVCRGEDMTVAVMGCVVTGRYMQACQHRHQSPGTGERPVAPVYEDGEKTVTLKASACAESSRNSSSSTWRAAMRAQVTHERARRRKCSPAEAVTTPLTPPAQQLLGSSPAPGLTENAHAIRREFGFRTLPHDELCQRRGAYRQHRDHHPDLEVGYNTCRVTSTTPSADCRKRLRVAREGGT